jgi:Tol biopolymer transport system component
MKDLGGSAGVRRPRFAYLAGAAVIGLSPMFGGPLVQTTFPAQASDLPILFQTDRNGTSDIFAMDAQGVSQEPVIAGPSNDEDPDWAPGGDRFSFSSDRDGTWQIYVVEITGGEPVQLTAGRSSNVDPVWSADGQRIAFESNRDGDWEIYVMNADGSDERNLSQSRLNEFDPTWAPDSRRVAFGVVGRGTADLHEVNVVTGSTTRLTATREVELDPAYAPTGSRIAFTRFVNGNYDLNSRNARGGESRRLTRASQPDVAPAWSPDGETIIYTSAAPGKDYELFAVPASGGQRTNLTTQHRGNDAEADWRPDSAAALLRFATTIALPASAGPGFTCGTPRDRFRRGPWTVVAGGIGRNRLCGSSRKDWLRGFDGNDKLAGSYSGDRLEGGRGGDLLLSADSARDQLFGGQVTVKGKRAAVKRHRDRNRTDVAWPDKTLDRRRGINKVNP